MKRRDFGRALAAGSVGTVALGCERIPQREGSVAPEPPPVLMHVGCQSGGVTAENLEFKKRHGVNNIDGGSPRYIPGKGWDRNEVLAMKEQCEKYGVSLDAFHLPLASSGIDRIAMPNIMLGKSPERDREIDDICRMIEIADETDVRLLNYNLTILPVVRTERTPGRGGSSYSTWELAKAQDAPLTQAGAVSEEEMWERIAYFLERVIPVATEHRVMMACHLPDPPTPPGYRGVTRVLGLPDAEGMKRFIGITPSDYHGFNFCIGSFAEGLENPGTEIFEHVRYFGQQRKIFNVHFRNITGKRDSFQEVYPDNGDIDMYRLIRVLREVEYPYMLMPDHVPQHPDDPGGRQAFAFAYGYIIALIQAVKAEA